MLLFNFQNFLSEFSINKFALHIIFYYFCFVLLISNLFFTIDFTPLYNYYFSLILKP